VGVLSATRLARWIGGAAVLLAIIGFFLLPYVWIIASSFKPQTAIFADMKPLSWRTFIPAAPTMANLVSLFRERDAGRALLNSAIVSLCQVAGTLMLCTLAAYGLTRIRFPGAGLVFALVLLTFLLPLESLMVPLYITVSGLGLQDTLAGVFLPWIASPFGLFLLRQAFEELPRELDEAATIDGAGHFRIFWSIVLPNVRTALATLSLVTFLFSWNAFLWPLVVLSSPRHAVIQIAVAQSVAPGQMPNWGQTFAGVTVATVPLIILFLFLQRFFVRGIAMTGVKG
jgi:multiple sugar transport system permease protein/putative chitobiose transport system permease protein